MSDERFMRRAIAEARKGISTGNTPFGACVVRNGSLVASAHNRVWIDVDITAHAEIVALRKACEKLGVVDLDGCVLYSTCEPCPMCFSAIHWANISKIIYGAQIKDAVKLGFRELTISNRRMKEMGGSPLEVIGPFLLEENLALFDFWSRQPERKTY